MSATLRAIAVLNLSPHIPDLIKQGYVCLLGFTATPVLANATTILPSFATNLAALDAANKAAATRAAGLIQARDGKRPAVVTNMHQLRSTVQVLADSLPPDQAEALILSAGMSVKKITKRVKNQYEVKQGSGSGLVTLTAEVAARHATYQWQMSTDQKSWTNLALTFRSKTHLGGLTPATTYYFRYQVTTPKTGTADWSQIVSLLVK